MNMALMSMAKRIAGLIRPESVQYEGAVLPAKHLRFGGRTYLRDRDFLGSARHEADRLVRHCRLSSDSVVLDLGCGVGRLPIGLLKQVSLPKAYWGVDVNEQAIRWCQRRVTPRDERFQFLHLNIHNERYNPEGRFGAADLKLPFEKGTFDLIYLYSVFSHLKTDDVRAYLKEFDRLLEPSGRVFLTAFLEDGVPEMEENPEGYGRSWVGPLHCVRYRKSFFETMANEHGFRIDRFDHARETDGQSGVYLSRSGAATSAT